MCIRLANADDPMVDETAPQGNRRIRALWVRNEFTLGA
jgi:hypothetical protein